MLQVLANSPNKALNYKQIGAQVPQISYKEVSQILEQLVNDNKIKQPEIGKYVFERLAVDEIIGKLDFNARGDAYLMVENLDDDIKIKSGDTLDSFDGDEVAVRQNRHTRPGKDNIWQACDDAGARVGPVCASRAAQPD